MFEHERTILSLPRRDGTAQAVEMIRARRIKLIREGREPREIDGALHAELKLFDRTERYLIWQRLTEDEWFNADAPVPLWVAARAAKRAKPT
jgi:hypothetical protein